jgi:hypothetical protein
VSGRQIPEPDWSVDGRVLYCLSARHLQLRWFINVLDVRYGHIQQRDGVVDVQGVPGWEVPEPDWSVDGRGLYCLSTRHLQLRWFINVLDVRYGHIQQRDGGHSVVDVQGVPGRQLPEPDWSVDGRVLYCLSVRHLQLRWFINVLDVRRGHIQ